MSWILCKVSWTDVARKMKSTRRSMQMLLKRLRQHLMRWLTIARYWRLSRVVLNNMSKKRKNLREKEIKLFTKSRWLDRGT